MGNKKIIKIASPTNNADAANKAYIDTNVLGLSDGLMTGNLNMDGNRIYDIPTPMGNAQPTPNLMLKLTF